MRESPRRILNCSVVIKSPEKRAAGEYLSRSIPKPVSVPTISHLVEALSSHSSSKKVTFSPKKILIEYGSPSHHLPTNGRPQSPSILKIPQYTIPENELLRAGIHNLRSPKRKLIFSDNPSVSCSTSDKNIAKLQLDLTEKAVAIHKEEPLGRSINISKSPKRKLAFSDTPSIDFVNEKNSKVQVDTTGKGSTPQEDKSKTDMPKSKRKQDLSARVFDISECINDSDLSLGSCTSDEEETWIVTKKSPKSTNGSEFRSPPSRNSVRRHLNLQNGRDSKKRSPKVTPIKLKRKVELDDDQPTGASNGTSIKTPKRLNLKVDSESETINEPSSKTPKRIQSKSKEDSVDSDGASTKTPKRTNSKNDSENEEVNDHNTGTSKRSNFKKDAETPKSRTSTPVKQSPLRRNKDDDDDDYGPSSWEPVSKSPSRKNKDVPSTPTRGKLSLRNRSTLHTPTRFTNNFSEADPPHSPRLRESARKSSLRIQVLEAASPISERKTRARRSTAKVLNYKEKENVDDIDDLFRDDVECTPRRRGRKSRFNTPDNKITLEDDMKTPKSSAKKKLLMTPTRTPLSAKKMGVGFLTPVVAERTKRLDGTPSSQMELARTQLHVSTVPKCLPCREKEYSNIKSFLERKIEDSAGGCMYISGVPGTGKTATVHAVVRNLQAEASKGDLPHFDFVEVNGLRLTEPRQAYVRLWQALTTKKLSFEEAHRALEHKFSGKPKHSTVFLIDELDYLCNRRQDVIYNILDWSTKYSSKLIVLTIANTMDLPERTLKGKVTSRMGLTRVVFQPYTYKQLQEIVLDRLSGTSSFHPDAVQLVSRKVAAVSGDARRALDICRRATEFVDDGIVKVSHVEKALNQIFTGTRVMAIKNCSLLEKLILRAIKDETQRTGIEETNIRSVLPQLSAVCSLEGFSCPSSDDVLSACHCLSQYGLVVAEKGRGDLLKKLSLNVSPDDIHYALNC